MQRLWNLLRESREHNNMMTSEARKDVDWWRTFLRRYTNNSMMWMLNHPTADDVMASDACLQGMGATLDREFIVRTFQWPQTDQQTWKIVHLELLAIIVGLKTWSTKLRTKRFVVKCDNIAVVHIINKGSSHDPLLQKLLREFIYVCSMGEFEVIAEHIMGVSNRLPRLPLTYQSGGGVLGKIPAGGGTGLGTNTDQG